MRSNLISILLLTLPPAAFAEPPTPTPFPLARYQAMMNGSPFALAVDGPAAQAVTQNPDFAKNLFLTGAARLNNGEYITVGSRDQNQTFALQTGSSCNGISLVSVAWSEAVGKTRATLKCGSEFATITFDEATLRAPAKPSPEASSPQQGNPKATLPPGVVPPKPNTPGAPARRNGRLVRPPATS
ncbi:MAG: hypothetical protein ACFUZC_01815 [Chthoniobacteraceae bacterium]